MSRTSTWPAQMAARRGELTQGEKSCDDPRWSPDGQWIAFPYEPGLIPDEAGSTKHGRSPVLT